MSDAKLKKICGIVMPISASDGCSESHWADVLQIINESVSAAGFEANLVSNADDAGVIHKRIIQNLYDNPIVVCDVSGKNPNVMFELGIRLAFDKPTVIIKDEKTSYSFDTSGIEHLPYPRDLRFSSIVDFKNKLTQKINSTYQKSIEDPAYSTFLKHFGEFKVAKIDQKEVSGQEYILEELKNLRQSIQRIEIHPENRYALSPRNLRNSYTRNELDFCLERWSDSKIDQITRDIDNRKDIIGYRIDETKHGHKHLTIIPTPEANIEALNILFEKKSDTHRTHSIGERLLKSPVII